MKPALLLSAALVLAFSAGVSSAEPEAAPALKLERVVMVMRHGIRPPTKAKVVPDGYSPESWPTWTVDYGLLTERGAAGVKLLGVYDRAYYEARGLLPTGCPAAGAVDLHASNKQRAIRTAQSWAEGFMPDCPATVAHPQEGQSDPVFHGLDDEPAWFEGQKALAAALAEAPEGGLAAEEVAHRAELLLLARVLGCELPACPVVTEPNRLVATAHDRPRLEGPFSVGSTASQTFLLQYLEAMPMKDVGWGRVNRGEIEQLLQFHPLKFKYSNRPDYIARAAAAPIASKIADAFAASGGARLTLLAGHDTNIADVGGFFQLHWKVPSYPADEIPPGSALGFELWSAAGGTHYVRAFYRAQTMDQLRELRPLIGSEAAFREYLPIPGCGNSIAATACSWAVFSGLIDALRAPKA